jgi:adenylate kinase family enzyme
VKTLVTVDDESTCLRCGQTITTQFNCSSGEMTQVTSCKCDKIEQRLRDKLEQARKETKKYHRAFDILHDYFASISDEEKPKVDRRLKRIGL